MEKTTPFGVKLTRSLVVYQAAQSLCTVMNSNAGLDTDCKL